MSYVQFYGSGALCRERGAQRPQVFDASLKIAGAALRPFRDARPLPQKHRCLTSDPLFFHKPESVTVSAQARQYAHSRITLVEVPMGKLALFLGGFLLLTILIGILGTIPPS
ncbi:hypothetical protein [Pseudomonas asiatica]|uniref:hypothetical protein n=1 Tax=Pseudomonas asiatica TaxID=2219225 RepID=UPI003457CFAF